LKPTRHTTNLSLFVETESARPDGHRSDPSVPTATPTEERWMLIPDRADPEVGLVAHVAALDAIPAKCGLTVTAWTLPAETAARRARSLLRAQVTPHIKDQAVLDDLDLMVSELGANAAIHADGPYELRIVRHLGVPVICEIADTGGGLDKIAENLRRHTGMAKTERDMDIDALLIGGRGLGVVAQLSAGRCGVRTTRLCRTGQQGKSVWFAIPAHGKEVREPVQKTLREAAAEVLLEVKSVAGLSKSGRF
jgi:anti-sigma regulatory factor (Ser/Thr protein kinase)